MRNILEKPEITLKSQEKQFLAEERGYQEGYDKGFDDGREQFIISTTSHTNHENGNLRRENKDLTIKLEKLMQDNEVIKQQNLVITLHNSNLLKDNIEVKEINKRLRQDNYELKQDNCELKQDNYELKQDNEKLKENNIWKNISCVGIGLVVGIVGTYSFLRNKDMLKKAATTAISTGVAGVAGVVTSVCNKGEIHTAETVYSLGTQVGTAITEEVKNVVLDPLTR